MRKFFQNKACDQGYGNYVLSAEMLLPLEKARRIEILLLQKLDI